MPKTEPSRILILGAGPIGLSFAAAFSDTGSEVTLVDPDPLRRDAVKAGLADQLEAMALAGLDRGSGGRVTVADAADGRLRHADLVLECGPEDLETKRRIFADLLADDGAACIIATASSAIPMSRIVSEAALQSRCFVAHPVNPPAVLRLVELVPAPATSPETLDRAEKLFADAGFRSVRLGREIEGFVMNRLQGAVLREAYRLVEEGVSDVEGIDAVMQFALGPRWALSGPFETADLNTPGGIAAHAKRMGPAYARMGRERGETVDWNEALVARVAAARQRAVPAADLPARVRWRARAVAQLIALRDRLSGNADE